MESKKSQQEICFRININIIHMIYRSVLRVTESKYYKAGESRDKILHYALGTNRTDISKYKSGNDEKKRKATSTMLNKVRAFDVVYEAVSGKRLIRFYGKNQSVYSIDKWEDILKNKNKVREVEKQFDMLIQNIAIIIDKKEDPIKEDEDIHKIIIWLMSSAQNYKRIFGGDNASQSAIKILKEINEKLKTLSIDSLDRCEYAELDRAYKELKKECEKVAKVYNYRALRESKNKSK